MMPKPENPSKLPTVLIFLFSALFLSRSLAIGETTKNKATGIFYQLMLSESKAVIWSFDFLAGTKKRIYEFNSVNASNIILKNNKLAFTKNPPPIDRERCIETYVGSIYCNYHLLVGDLSDLQNSTLIATDIASFGFSPDATEIFYSLYDNATNQSALHRYQVGHKTPSLVLKNWKGLIDPVLGSSVDKRTVFFAANGDLYKASRSTARLLLRTGGSGAPYRRKFGVGFQLSNDSSKVLIEKGTRWGILEVGVFQIAGNKYQILDAASMRMDINASRRWTEDSNGISGELLNGSYGVFNLSSQETREIIKYPMKGLFLGSSLKSDRILLVQNERTPRGETIFFLEPPLPGGHQFTVEQGRYDRSPPSVYFIGWER